jgi:predicted transposase YbfD/YdcC
MAAAFACGRVCLRRVEDLAEDLGPAARSRLGLPGTPSDSALYRLLARQSSDGLRETLEAQIHDLERRKLIVRDLFAKGVLSMDGKVFWTSTVQSVEGAKVSVNEEAGVVTSSLMAVRAVLTSSSVRPCLGQEIIGEKTGEAPAFRVLFPQMVEQFGHLFEIVTGDAGLGCRENASVTLGSAKHYLFSLKGNQPTLEAAAEELFASSPSPAQATSREYRDGAVLSRELSTVSVAGHAEVVFPGAKQFWRVVQRSQFENHLLHEEVRYFITDLEVETFGAERALGLVRLHWGIENGANWTMDAILREDDVQPCQQRREALEVVSWLRVLGYNLLSAFRACAPKRDRLPQSWARSVERLRDAFCFGTEVLLTPLG